MMPQGLRVFLKGVSVRRSEGKGGGIGRLTRKCARPASCFRRREDRLGCLRTRIRSVRLRIVTMT